MPGLNAPSVPQARQRSALVEAAIILVAFVVVGIVCGWIWHAWWAPGPEAVVIDGKPYFRPDEDFAGTGLFAVVAVVAGLVVGLVCTWIFERDEVVSLAALVIGSVVASALMLLVGHALGPDSATEAAKGAKDGAMVPGDLWVRAWAAYAAMPLGALIGASVVLVSTGRRGSGKGASAPSGLKMEPPG